MEDKKEFAVTDNRKLQQEADLGRSEAPAGKIHNETPPGPAYIAPPPKPAEKKSFIQTILDADFLAPWFASRLIPGPYLIDNNTGLVIRNPSTHSDVECPWFMTNNDGTRECDLYKHVEGLYKIIPPPCMNCWKVTVALPTLKTLFQTLLIQKQMVAADPYCFCKCGIEVRPTVERNYGAYWYCNSQAQGLDRLDQVREIFKLNGLGDIKIILKRGCTEYERDHGPSQNWDAEFEANPWWTAVWNKVLSIVKTVKEHVRQPSLIQDHVLVRWISYAASIGDPSLPELNGGKKLYPGYASYERPAALVIATPEVK